MPAIFTDSMLSFILLKDGNLMVKGTPDEVMSEALLKTVFDLDVEIHRDPVSQTPMFILK
ncbi:iron-dicitrate transporter ATP-binding subunit [Aggregatibacter actinomycetemcomitans serotype e str. SC1083]|uniref:Iron-dicitrate transporter ATP-binding subunit n=1 Tax=Aggregatibacter actinomycetemcomitans serotype e str. SC1083 TaxID=907488 RepID=G4A8M9_AGGAC|nr:iron-dicitrate transporter ATP-binding subunit [Aggregatibacter actinomycetemcomitans serotype e str. SC1083]